MKVKLLVGILVFLIVLNLATIGTFVYLHFARDRHPIGHPMMRMHDDLRRTARAHKKWLRNGDRRQLMSLLVEFREETHDLRNQLHDIEQATLAAFEAEPFSEGTVDSLLRAGTDVRLEMSRRAVQKLIDAKEFLTPEQQRLFYKAIIEGRPMGRRHGMMKQRRGR